MVGRRVGLHLRRVLVLLVVRRGDREVRRVVEHIFLLRVDIDLEVAYGERRRLMDGVGHLLDGVSLRLRVISAEGLAKFHIGVQRVVVRARCLVAVGDVERHLDLRFLREESSGFEGRAHGELVEVIQVAVKHVRLNRSIARGL